MPINTKDVPGQIIAGIATAVILGLATLLWNEASNGGIVRALGGVTSQDVEALVKKLALAGPPGPMGRPRRARPRRRLPRLRSLQLRHRGHHPGRRRIHGPIRVVSCRFSVVSQIADQD